VADLFDNPMGLDGFEFVEFASPTPGVLEPVFDALGFAPVAKHKSKDVTLYLSMCAEQWPQVPEVDTLWRMR